MQAWRFPSWEPGAYSIVRFTPVPTDGGTRLLIDQHSGPDNQHDHTEANRPTFYLNPLIRHFSASDAA